MTDKEIVEEIEYQEAFDIINNSSLKGKGSEPSCFFEYEYDMEGEPIASFGWNKPNDARWFFFTDIAIALKEAKVLDRKQFAEETKNGFRNMLSNSIYKADTKNIIELYELTEKILEEENLQKR